MSMRRRGLIIGKFMPPHRGHQFLIETAAKQVDELTIILFTKSTEPIPAQLRVEWLRALAGTHHVIHVTDEHPIDFDNPAIWELWVGSIRRVYSTGPDFVFSSENYGDELAKRLDARHVRVDPERRTVPISASQIRERPWRFWDFIPECARSYFVQRICILGAESTGKTTLARQLAEHFSTTWSPEFAREYLEKKKTPCTLDDIPLIAREQVTAEDRAARQADRFLFCDTDLLVTSLWSEFYFDKVPAEVAAMERHRCYALYLLTAPDLAWVHDGLRDAPQKREWFHNRFNQELSARGAGFVEIAGHGEARFDNARRAVNTAFPMGDSSRRLQG